MSDGIKGELRGRVGFVLSQLWKILEHMHMRSPDLGVYPKPALGLSAL